MPIHDVVAVLFLFSVPVMLMLTAVEAEQYVRIPVRARRRR